MSYRIVTQQQLRAIIGKLNHSKYASYVTSQLSSSWNYIDSRLYDLEHRCYMIPFVVWNIRPLKTGIRCIVRKCYCTFDIDKCSNIIWRMCFRQSLIDYTTMSITFVKCLLLLWNIMYGCNCLCFWDCIFQRRWDGTQLLMLKVYIHAIKEAYVIVYVIFHNEVEPNVCVFAS